MAGITVPPGTRCLLAEVGGVGRDFPLSMEKLSPILAFYVEDGVERGAARCFEILSYGGMGHTAGVHTRSREIAKAYGMEMPASRVVVNTPTTHGAIGFSTALPPSMTLGCGSWGGNVTSDNISPLHLMDIKRVAFETRPVPSARPARAATAARPAVMMPAPAQTQPAGAAQTGARVSREDVAAIVDRFLSTRGVGQTATTGGAPSAQPAGNGGTTQPAPAAPTVEVAAKPAAPAGNGGAKTATTNGRKPVEFVSEDDVRRAIQKGEKIYVNARTIITPSAHDLGDPAEVFAKV
jgi:hypothetical protein